jgi:UDP-2,4-diacetamido-2,4,6-trideoxy-beta-L-altropyranose hydrolase
MRCLALAQAWQVAGGSVSFVGTLTPAVAERLESERIDIRPPGAEPGTPEEAAETAQCAEKVGASWVVVDGYHFESQYQRRLREEGRRVLFIDDYGHADWYDADLVLNQNIDAEATLYEERAPHTDLLLGPKFALLRKEFWPWREPRRTPRTRASRVLVTLGGADPDNLTTRVVRGLGQFDAEDVRVTVLVGGSNPHERAVRAAAKASGESVEVRSDVDDMASLMAESDVAVSAGGSTCWELAFMGIPNVIVVLAENQRGIAKGLDEAGTAINLGWHESVEATAIRDRVELLLTDEGRRLRMAQAAQRLVDGNGTGRVLDKMQSKRPAHTSTVEQPSESR